MAFTRAWLGGACAALFAAPAVAASFTGDPAATCNGLAGSAWEAVRIDNAAMQAPSHLSLSEHAPTPSARVSPSNPAYCKVLGHIEPADPKAPPIKFQVNLPAEWNNRSLQYGGGGFNGVLITGLALPPAYPYDKPSPLARGFVTYGTDSGHTTKNGEPPQLFALNDEAFENFAHVSYKKVRDAAVVLMTRAYGRKPDRMYFMGSSEGGREGLTMAQRYPEDFDGIFARVPVINWVGLQHANTRAGLATMGEGWIRPAQVKLVADAVLKACDKADGSEDLLIEDPVGCKARFKAVMMELSRLSAKFEENVLDAINAWSHHVRDAGQLAGINEAVVDQARRRAVEKGVDGWLFGLDQPTYVAVVTVMIVVTLLACYVPTRRAMQVDPFTALRQD